MALEGTNRTIMGCIPANSIACGRPSIGAACGNHGLGNHARPRAWAGRSGPAVRHPQIGQESQGSFIAAIAARVSQLKSRLPTLWTNSCFVSTVGGAPLAVIKQYVENQKDV